MTRHRIRAHQVSDSYLEKLRAVQPLARAALCKMDRSLPVDIPETPMKRCNKCGEEWPATDEFFFRQKGVLRSPCRCCIDEKRAETNAIKTCAIPGCGQPRYSSRHSYCWTHRYGSAGYFEALAEQEVRR